MNTNDLTWKNFYKEFASKLLAYKDDRKSLLSKLSEIYKKEQMKMPKIEKDESLIDIDPFTVFGFLNRDLSSDNRYKLLEEIAKEFKITNKIPSTIVGVPLLTSQNTAFFSYLEKRKENDINNLWDLFEIALKYVDDKTEVNKLSFIDSFDKVISQRGVRWNITMGLYWICPDAFLTLDRATREFFKTNILSEKYRKEVDNFKSMISGSKYLDFCEKTALYIKDDKNNFKNFTDIVIAANEDIHNTNAIHLDKIDIQKTDVNKNTILYGPPGTGKTYHTAIYAVAIIENRTLKEVMDEEYDDVMSRYREYKEEGLIEFITFHQSYSYEEFIEGIKPVMNSQGDKADIQYEISSGIFKSFCEKARSDQWKNENLVFIIDEINRGNISKIFGELITLIESNKRLGQKESMEIKLPYSQKHFAIPDNVYLVGTMNTVDRSIATMDTALRRRFTFREMMPNSDVLADIFVEGVSIKDIFVKINKRISVLYDREHAIGHAYFMPLKQCPDLPTLAGIFKDSIIPLLQEYFYEDYDKIRLVLGDNNKPSAECQFVSELPFDEADIFGDANYDFDDYTMYEINKDALYNIDSYKFI